MWRTGGSTPSTLTQEPSWERCCAWTERRLRYRAYGTWLLGAVAKTMARKPTNSSLLRVSMRPLSTAMAFLDRSPRWENPRRMENRERAGRPNRRQKRAPTFEEIAQKEERQP